jgi:hypothetical protein
MRSGISNGGGDAAVADLAVEVVATPKASKVMPRLKTKSTTFFIKSSRKVVEGRVLLYSCRDAGKFARPSAKRQGLLLEL